MFWGITFLLIGLFIVLNAVFGIDLPIMRILVGFFIVYLGLKFIMGPKINMEMACGGSCNPAAGKVVFSSGLAEPKNLDELRGREFSSIFGHGELDLTKTAFENEARLKINSIFGSVRVFIPMDVSLIPKVNSVAGSVNLPREASAPGKVLNVEINNVFGTTQFERK